MNGLVHVDAVGNPMPPKAQADVRALGSRRKTEKGGHRCLHAETADYPEFDGRKRNALAYKYGLEP